MTGTIFNIQHYSVHDGPGIRTLIFFKGCPLRCMWCCNPESQSKRPQLRYLSPLCKACLDCLSSCPYDAIQVRDGVIHRQFELCEKCEMKSCVDECNHDAVAISGREITAVELMDIIAKDMAFYRNSGGGVTFSGGEPLMQPEFLLEMLKKCKKHDIHTAVDSCGWADKKSVETIIPYTDLFLFDLKIIDPEMHLLHLGNTVEPILDNLKIIAASGKEIVIRLPLIPGITDTLNNLLSVSQVLNSYNLQKIYIEPYHTLGREKYDEHGIKYSLDHLELMDSKRVKEIQDFFMKQGISCEIA